MMSVWVAFFVGGFLGFVMAVIVMSLLYMAREDR